MYQRKNGKGLPKPTSFHHLPLEFWLEQEWPVRALSGIRMSGSAQHFRH
jgi:hypothetical protein